MIDNYESHVKLKRHRAAALIQRIYEGHRARTRVGWRLQLQRSERKRLKALLKRRAVVFVQSRFRGMVVRKRTWEVRIRGEVIKCQAVARLWLAKRRVTVMISRNVAATSIQTCWRRYWGERTYLEFMQENRKKIKPALVVRV